MFVLLTAKDSIGFLFMLLAADLGPNENGRCSIMVHIAKSWEDSGTKWRPITSKSCSGNFVTHVKPMSSMTSSSIGYSGIVK